MVYDGQEESTGKGQAYVEKHSGNSLLVQGGILAAAGLVTKLLGFLYRIPMANMLGEQGNGIYSVAFSIYNIALTLSSYSLPAAVSKLISERLGRRERGAADRVFRAALLFALVGGLAAFAALFFGASALESFYHRDGLARPLRVLAPTALVVAVLGVVRGWFQGRGNMAPTAVSQVLEQAVNVAVSLLAAWQLLRTHGGDPSYGAAGGTLGTLAGAAAAQLFMLLLWNLAKSRRRRALPAPEPMVWRALLLTCIPMLLSQSIYQLGATVDDLLFGRAMEAQGMADTAAAALQGVYNSQYNQMTTLPVAITTAMAAALLPGIALLWSQGRRQEAMSKARTVIKLNMALAIPAAVGLAVLAGPIMDVLFPRLDTYRDLASAMLEAGSAAVVFYALSTNTASVLQGSGHVHRPAANAAAALILHTVLMAVLLWRTELGVWALIVGNVTFPLTLALLNCHAMGKLLGYRWEAARTFVLPCLVSVPMGLAAWGVSRGAAALSLPTSVGLVLAVAVAVGLYLPLLLRLGCFSPAELRELPMSRLFRRLAGRR